MKNLVFASTCFLAILLVSAVVIILTGAIDPHFGYAGSILKTIIPSIVATLVLTIAFWLASILFKGRRTRRNLAITGALAGAAAHALAWVFSEPLQDIHMLTILFPYAALGVFASFLNKDRNG
ncbi:MAG: hypothetical protein EOO16_12490 [Chitinophagaceae bacterium]|nr:MAG: hypothetical protein EOO16_12490 [Chitinophagaceae bacterium]